MVYNIWGAFAGDPSRERMYAQEACTDYSPIMRFVCQVGRFRTTAVPTNDGLWVGLVTLAVLNDNTKLHDPSQWQWAGYLATLTGGTPVVPSWLCVDVNLAWTPTTPLFLLMCTNGSYEVCGWDMCGYNDTGFPQVQNLGEYNYNEPNKPNGWTVMDNRYKGAIHIYSPPAGQVVEGLSDIVNPVFCTTVQAGANCAFSFNVNQLTAFPCGCPETIVWQLFNRDTGVALGAATQHLLACGYTGVTGFGGNIVFTGAGVFHGQLKAGHLNADGTTWTVDDTYNFDVTVTALPCTTYTTKATCEAAGCWWWNGACHSSQPTACNQLNNSTDCARWSCFWCNGACQSTPCDTSVTLDKAVTVPPTGWAGGCDPHTSGSCTCGNEPATKTTFAMVDEVIAYSKISATDLYGKVMKHEWWWNGVKVYEYTWPALAEHWDYACYCTLWPEFGNSNGPGSGNIKIIVDGVYLGSTNTFTIEAPPCSSWGFKESCEEHDCYWWNYSCHSTSPTCTQLNNQTDCLAYSCYWYNNQCNSNPPPNTTIATIDSGVYHTGPYSAGQLVELAVIQVRNTGNTTGKLYGCSFFNPGQANESRNTQSEVNIAANGVWAYHPVAEIPANQQPGQLSVGVKVWGATESEPGWSLSQSLRGDVEIW